MVDHFLETIENLPIVAPVIAIRRSPPITLNSEAFSNLSLETQEQSLKSMLS